MNTQIDDNKSYYQYYLLLLVCIASWVFFKYLQNNTRTKQYIQLQGPTAYTHNITNLFAISTHPEGFLGFLLHLVKQYGNANMDPIPFTLVGKQCFLITHPETIHKIHSDTEKHFIRTEGIIKRMKSAIGYNVITADYREHNEIRKRIHPQLNTSHYFSRLANVMFKVANSVLIEKWHQHFQQRKQMDIFSEMLIYSSIVVFNAFLNVPIETLTADGIIHEKLNQMFGFVRDRTLSPFVIPLWLPTPANQLFKQTWQYIASSVEPYIKQNLYQDTLAGSIIRAHTEVNLSNLESDQIASFISEKLSEMNQSPASKSVNKNLVEQILKELDSSSGVNELVAQILKELGLSNNYNLSAAIAGKICEFGKSNDTLIREEVISMLVAGSETTIVLMTWCWYFLAQNIELQNRIVEEAQAISIQDLNNKPEEILTRLSFLKNVITETLRHRGPAFANGRQALHGVELDLPTGNRKFFIPKNSYVFLSQYITHHSENLWSEPERFKPDRFQLQKPRRGKDFYPFSHGGFSCSGEKYAIVEAAWGILTPLLEGYRVELADPSLADMPLNPTLTLRPKVHPLFKISRVGSSNQPDLDTFEYQKKNFK